MLVPYDELTIIPKLRGGCGSEQRSDEEDEEASYDCTLEQVSFPWTHLSIKES